MNLRNELFKKHDPYVEMQLRWKYAYETMRSCKSPEEDQIIELELMVLY